MILNKLLNQNAEQRREQRRTQLRDKLIRHEAKIGGALFGPVNPGERREFFCLDEHTWVWYEEWVEPATGLRKSQTTRYDIRPDSILKVQHGQYRPVGKEEALRFYDAILAYDAETTRQIYQPAYM